ncbi:hypothetical protein [Flavobacterium filum]|uniref:hypothetical protein n=1 Tax=Flavobacterium filum TaxID=370974 RepID=UPI00041D7687|nr:hypothetical protein [Flavobacterium filum]
METKEIIKLILPLLAIGFGIFIKITKNENYSSTKKYWLFIVIVGVLLFLFRLYKYLK